MSLDEHRLHYLHMRDVYQDSIKELCKKTDYLEQQLSALVEYINEASKKPGWLVLHEIKQNLLGK